MKRFIKIIALALAAMLLLCSCNNGTYSTSSKETVPAGNIDNGGYSYDQNEEVAEDSESSATEHPKVKFTMDSGGSFIVELYPEYAPKTVENFLNLVSIRFYDGLTFHRIVDDFMAQGGDPKGDGTGGSSNKIKGEFSTNGYTKNTLSHTRGVISMARSGNPNSASSQFFICYGDATFLDGDYAAFGRVIEGMEVVDSFLEVERMMGNDGAISKPVEPIIIESAVVL